MSTQVDSNIPVSPPVQLESWVVHATYCPKTDDDTCQICKQKLTFIFNTYIDIHQFTKHFVLHSVTPNL